MNKRIIHTTGVLAAMIVQFGCTPADPKAEFERWMSGTLPSSAQVDKPMLAGDRGTLFTVHMSKDDFAFFQKSLTHFSQWYEPTGVFGIEAAGKEVDFDSKDHIQYSVRDSSYDWGGLDEVFVWDEKTQTLTAALATAVGG